MWVMNEVGHADKKMTIDVYVQLQLHAQREHGRAFDASGQAGEERLTSLTRSLAERSRPPLQAARTSRIT